MMRPQFLAIALSALAFVAAQTSNFTIDPTKIPASQRSQWCQAEFNTCLTLCGRNVKVNDCNTVDLTFHCTCSNGTAPGLEYYTQTMPTFICEQAFQDCIAANAGNKPGQDACTANIKSKCGTLDPNKLQVDSSASASASGTATAATSGASTAPSTSSSRAAAPTNAAYFGNGVAAVAAAGFLAALL